MLLLRRQAAGNGKSRAYSGGVLQSIGDKVTDSIVTTGFGRDSQDFQYSESMAESRIH